MSQKALTPVNVPWAAADPTIPSLRAGDVYANSTTKALRSYDGAAWHEHDTLDQAATLSGAKTFTGGIVANSAVTGSGTVNLTGVGASSVAGTMGATAFVPSGLTGSTAATRFVGGTATGAPTTGAHNAGDLVVAQNGHIWVCTAAGTPGTWVDAGSYGAGGGVTPATTVTSGTAYGVASAVGTSTNYAREDHTHGTPATPVTSAAAGAGISVSAATGAVTVTNTGALLTANTFSGLQTFNAGLIIPSGQALVTGTRGVVTGTRATTTNATDTVDLGAFTSTGGAIELRIHAHLAAPAAGTTASVTKIYEIAAGALMGSLNAWYLCLPADASANAAAGNDFALEVQRTGAGVFVFRFRQKSISVAGGITYTVESLGDVPVVFTASTTVTAAPTAVSTPHPSNAFVAAAGNVGIGTEAPAYLLDVAGTVNATSVNATSVQDSGSRVYSPANPPPYPVASVAGRTGAVTLTAADIGAGTFPGAVYIGGGDTGISQDGSNGFVRFQRGTGTNTGYTAGFAANGSREWYIGWATGNTGSDAGVLSYNAGQHVLQGNGAYGAAIADFHSPAGAAQITVSDASATQRVAYFGVATASGDWFVGSAPGDMILRSQSGTISTNAVFRSTQAIYGSSVSEGGFGSGVRVFSPNNLPTSVATSTGTVSARTSTYGSVNISGSSGGWAGITFTDVGANQTLMMGTSAWGVYDGAASVWRWQVGSLNGAAQWSVISGPMPGGTIGVVANFVSGATSSGTFGQSNCFLQTNRRYKVTYTSFDHQATVTTDRFTFQAQAGLTNVGQSVTIPNTGTLMPGITLVWQFVWTGGNGNNLVGVNVVRAAGTGTLNINGATVLVEDIGL